MAASSPGPPPPPRAGKGVSARLAQTHLAGCVGVRDPGLEASRGGWRRGGGGWRRMAPRSAPPVSLAHSAAGLRLTAHPGNRRPREHPPPPASLSGWSRPLICIGGGAFLSDPSAPQGRPYFKKERQCVEDICIKGRDLQTLGRRLARETPWRRQLRRVDQAECGDVGAQNLHDGRWEKKDAHA